MASEQAAVAARPLPLYLGPYRTGPNHCDHQGIYHGEARTLSVRLPLETVDLIMADPLNAYLPEYVWLGRLAALVLKADGHLLVWSSMAQLNEIMRLLDATLHYRGLLCVPRNSASRQPAVATSPLVPNVALCLWYSRSAVSLPREAVPIMSRPASSSRARPAFARDFAAVSSWCRAFCPPEGIVFDPFCLDGVVPAAACMAGRCYVAFAPTPLLAAEARRRLAATPPGHRPIARPEGEQAMLLETTA